MPDKLIHGVYAAILTPRHAHESIDEASFVRLLHFLLERGISRFAINGATGEFCLTTPEHLRTLLSITRKTASHANILCGIGAAGTAATLELAGIAAGEGAQAALLPMPYFFPYEQADLEAFVEGVAGSVALPVLLYNLPEFTSALKAVTSCHLIREVPNVIGIKDSGRSPGTLRMLTREGIPACRIVGNDGMLADALREQVCDGVVSGVACVLPELISTLFAERDRSGSDRFKQLSELLDVFRDQVSRFPTPWGLKWIAEAREICAATFSQPVAEVRRHQGQQLMAWYRAWEANLFAIVNSTGRLSARTSVSDECR
jgi:dihydrodipicolinate synthase/N-acetylneuraminate lyase